MRTAGWREILRMLRSADLVLEVVDARAPEITRSRRLERMAESRGRPVVIVLNKSDLVPDDVSLRWAREFSLEGVPTLRTSATRRMGTLLLRRRLEDLLPKPSTVLVAGYPKVGKSSLINVLKGRHSARTSSVPGNPGYTRHFQRYRISKGISLLDSPGILPPGGRPVEIFLRGASPEEVPNPVEVAADFIRVASSVCPGALSPYGAGSGDPLKVLEAIAIRRGLRYDDGEPNLEEAARLVMRDYHRGRIPFYIPPGLRELP